MQTSSQFAADGRAICCSESLASLISQLEQSKFVRLFRYLINSQAAVPRAGHDIGKPAVALDLPDAELHFKLAGSVGSFGHHTAAWLFQIAHAPEFLSTTEFEIFAQDHLRRAFKNLREMSPYLQSGKQRVEYLTEYHSASEGCDDYYLFTNLCADVGQRALEKFSDVAHRLCREITGIPPDRHPAFGVATPETLITSSAAEVKPFIVDLLNTPSGYYFVAREGRISVVSVTEHGAFLATANRPNREQTSGLSTVLTHSVEDRRDATSTALRELEFLINGSKTREHDLQRFFTSHPEILFGLDDRYCEIRPHVCLFDGKGEKLVPDFMARIQDSNIWDVIELKLPQHTLTVRRQEVEKASAAAARGVAELLRSRDFFAVHDNRARVVDRFNTAPYEPALVLVIGRGRPGRLYEWSSTRRGFPNVKIVSYDYLFEQARARVALLRVKHRA